MLKFSFFFFGINNKAVKAFEHLIRQHPKKQFKKNRCIKEERADKCKGAGRFLCEKATGILLILLDMGVVQRGEKGEDGEGVHTKNTHLLSLPFPLSPCFVSTSSSSLSLSHCSEHPPSSQAPSHTRSGLLSIK